MKVEGVRSGRATVVTDDGTRDTMSVDDLVVVAEFGEPVYPGLVSVGSIRRGGDKPAHVVINAENHHALEMLQFTHGGKVDCIYIDPPYNTGAKDWSTTTTTSMATMHTATASGWRSWSVACSWPSNC